MIFQSIKYKAFAMLVGVAVLCAGCHSGSSVDEPDDPDIPTAEPDMVTLCLDVSYGLDHAPTRADNDPDGYENPEGSFEQISSLRVIIVRNMSADNTLGTVEANRLVATSDEGFPKYDNLRFKVVEELTPKRIYLIANEKSITSAPTGFDSASEFLDWYKVGESIDLTRLALWTVELPADGVTGDVTTMGLFSDSNALYPKLPLTEYFDIIAKPEATQSSDNIYYSHLFLTRAAAKATFFVDQKNSSPAYDNVSINAIKLIGVGSKEYVFPHDASYSKGKYPEGSNALDATVSSVGMTDNDLEIYITGFDTPEGNRSMTYLMDGLNVPVVDTASTDPESQERQILKAPIYFPESILAADKHYEVSVLLSNGVWLTAPLQTKDNNIANILNIGGHEAIARNTHLKITLKIEAQELAADVTIVPYIGINLTPGFGFEQLLPGDHHQPTDW